ncbi:MAG: metallophosphoesterase [Bacillota bacterium]|jgi:predicted phosphohydrolase|nr:phosphohydrolase [Clostridia bacterium]
MKIFALGDLHLSISRPIVPGEEQEIPLYKPMDVFGPQWQNHAVKLLQEWTDHITDDDAVLIPGDISWAMNIEEACFDFDFLGMLPGKLILLQGNHDYWWKSISRVRQALPKNCRAIQNDGILLGDTYIAGTRGWICPGSTGFSQHDERIYLRELKRLELSLRTVSPQAKRVVAMMHFLPTNDFHEHSGFIKLMEEYGVEYCVYGHLHQGAFQQRLPEEKWGIRFYLVSADYLGFRPRLIWPENNTEEEVSHE